MDKKDLESLLNPANFKSIEVEFSISNSTTRTQVKATLPIKLTEISEKGMIVEIPEKSCSVGHKLVVDVRVKPVNSDAVTFSSTAHVERMDHGSDGTDRISILLVQYREEEWTAFRTVFAKRQNEIDDFLTAAKGYK